MAENTVIIGAGGSGRGFLARLLQEDGARICFLDKNEGLIEELQKKGGYGIRVGKKEPKVIIQDYEAWLTDSEAAVERAARADFIFTSVGAEHLEELAPFLERAALRRKALGQKEPLKITVCENGISPKRILKRALQNTAAKNSLISQGVIFCTSISESEGSLDIVSEDYQKLPYDVDEELFRLPFRHFPATQRFEQLLQRKIYTYNCLSACIAYLGFYLKYDIYADAANDNYIRQCCECLTAGLNHAICRSMHIDLEEQREFSGMAMKKFCNRDISDTIYKNVRSAVRKLSPTERIMGPMNLMEQAGEDISVLELVTAAALYYLENNEELIWQEEKYPDALSLFCALNPQMKKETLTTIRDMLEKFRRGEQLESIYYIEQEKDAVNYN